MTASAKHSLSPLLPDVSARGFADLGEDEAARLTASLRPLAWVDGLIAATVIAPDISEDWLEHLWAEGAPDRLTPAEAAGLVSIVEDHFCHVVDVLHDSPDSYRPILAGVSELEAAAQWAAGFRFGIRLNPESWSPLIDDDASRALLAAVFCLEREEDLPEEERTNSPFRDISPERREEMRRSAGRMLPDIVRGLHEFSLALDRAPGNDDLNDAVSERTYSRASPKIGRNEPCPCGSGRKYKKCCLAG